MNKTSRTVLRNGVTGLAVIAASLMTASTQAASVTFQNSVIITDTSALDAPLSLSPGATLVQAVNFGSGAQSVLTIGGQTINFSDGTTSFAGPSGTSMTLFFAGSENNGNLFAGDTGSAAFNAVLDGQGWASSGNAASPETLRIGGLTAGTQYLVQLLASDMRAGSTGRTQQYHDSVTFGGNSSDSFSVQNPTYVVATFTADGNGFQDIFIQDTRAVHPPWDTTFAAFTLYSVPEPSSAALLLTGAGLLMGWRARRRA